MNKLISFAFLLTILLSACAPAAVPATVTAQPTFTPAPTFTPTTTPTITPSPTPTEIPFVSFAATVDDCTTKQTAERSYASWADLLVGELGDTANHAQEIAGWGLTYELIRVQAKVLDVVIVPVTTAYWKSQNVSKAHLLCIAFPNSTEAGFALGGFTMNDGTYVPMITHLNGGDPTGDGSDDIALPSASSLSSLMNGLYYMRVATYSGFDPARNMSTWGWITEEKDSDVPYSYSLYVDEIVRRGELGEKLWVAAWINPDGYVQNILGLWVVCVNENKQSGGAPFIYQTSWIIRYMAGEYSNDWATITIREPVEDGFILVDKIGTDEFGISALPNAYR